MEVNDESAAHLTPLSNVPPKYRVDRLTLKTTEIMAPMKNCEVNGGS